MIQNIQNMLIPEAANIVFMSPRVSGECSLQEPWFGTAYSVEGKLAQLCMCVAVYAIQHILYNGLL